jgi:hypothetical protein
MKLHPDITEEPGFCIKCGAIKQRGQAMQTEDTILLWFAAIGVVVMLGVISLWGLI